MMPENLTKALGIASGTFGRLRRKYGVETPYMQRQRRPKKKELDRLDPGQIPSESTA